MLNDGVWINMECFVACSYCRFILIFFRSSSHKMHFFFNMDESRDLSHFEADLYPEKDQLIIDKMFYSHWKNQLTLGECSITDPKGNSFKVTLSDLCGIAGRFEAGFKEISRFYGLNKKHQIKIWFRVGNLFELRIYKNTNPDEEIDYTHLQPPSQNHDNMNPEISLQDSARVYVSSGPAIVPGSLPAASTPSSSSMPSSRPRSRSLVLRYASSTPLTGLDHVSFSPDLRSLWNAHFCASDILPKEALIAEADRALMERVGPMGCFQSAETFLMRVMGIMRYHGLKYDNMARFAKSAGVEASKVAKLREALSSEHDKHLNALVAFAASVKSNLALSTKVQELMERFTAMRRGGDDLYEKLASAEVEREVLEAELDEVNKQNEKMYNEVEDIRDFCYDVERLRKVNYDLKKENDELKAAMQKSKNFEQEYAELKACMVGRVEELDALKNEMQKRLESRISSVQKTVDSLQAEISRLNNTHGKLNEELLEAKRSILREHKNGFEKAVRQSLLFHPELDAQRFELYKDVVDGELMNESDIEYDGDEGKSGDEGSAAN